ncbi:MAG TPA: DUF4390 domain-containing protein [Rubrivivax sp.]
MLQRLQDLGRCLLALPLVVALAVVCAGTARAQGVEMLVLQVERSDGALVLDYAARLQLSTAAEDAVQRGVPIYFVAQASLWRNRWYWRDERVARVSRSWRLAFQPLTSTWRVGIGAITQSFATLPEALAVISRTSGWKLADAAQVDPDSRHYVEFELRLDTTQLPSPMQIGLTGQADWQLGVERTLRVEP